MSKNKETENSPGEDWFNLYSAKWGELITPAATAHPAKFARNLIRRIYEHAFEEGWLQTGDQVIDVFGGVALGAFDAMRFGLHWTGCELEARFVALGEENIKLWNERYAGKFAGWGTARLIQGDSRKLAEVVTSRMAATISSPPYAGNEKSDYILSEDGKTRARDERRQFKQGKGCFRGSETYGQSDGQLGAMRDADFKAAISSPPYAGLGVQKEFGEGPNGKPPAQSKYMKNAKPFDDYGDDPDNLDNLKEGDFKAVIASPPFVESLASDDPQKRGGLFRDEKRANDKTLTATYGASNGQVGVMKEGKFDAVIASPPFESVEGAHSAKKFKDPEASAERRSEGYRTGKLKGNNASKEAILRSMEKANEQHYGDTEGNLGNLRSAKGEFEAVISSPPYEGSLDHAPGNKNWKETATDTQTRHGNKGYSANVQNNDGYGTSEGNVGIMKGGDFDAAITSPPYEEQPGHSGTWGRFEELALGKALHRPDYGDTEGQIGRRGPDTFWSASRLILEQCFQVLAPGAHAIFVTKRFVRAKQIVEFSDQWVQLCEAVGFRLVCRHKAWQVEYHGEQFTLDGEVQSIETRRASFFRILAEAKGSPKILWEDVLCFLRP